MTAPVFRHYDRAALDAEYNNRAKVARALDWIGRYGAESARARAELPLRFDVPYGPHHAQRLDVFPAAGAGPAPVHLFVHGGYWHRMDKADFSFVTRGLRPAGVATVVLNYGLVPSVDLDTLVGHCRAAVAWVHAHAADFGGDPSRIFVSGHSAGGHLVAMLLATDWKALGAPADVLKGGCAISGLYDLEPIRLCYLNDVLGLTPESARRNSPLALPRPRAGSLVLAVGGEEGAEYHRQTSDLAAAWAGAPIEVLDLAGHDHFSIVAELESPFSALARAVQRQMGVA
ncbi:MAG TPA: alpha/beta hydrolase [Methylomirabilota bacterium]|nr:alpha/beta hydrolase [Methylomirabilota bacterium]